MNRSETNTLHTRSILIFVGKESKYVLFDCVEKINLQSFQRQSPIKSIGVLPSAQGNPPRGAKLFLFFKKAINSMLQIICYSQENCLVLQNLIITDS